MDIFSLNKGELIRYLIALIASFILSIVIYFALNASLDGSLYNTVLADKDNSIKVAKAYDLIFKLDGTPDENLKVFRSSSLDATIASLPDRDPEQLIKALLYGKIEDTENYGQSWGDVKQFFLLPYLPNANVSLTEALDLLKLAHNKSFQEKYGDKEKFNAVKEVFSQDYLSPFLDDIKRLNSYKWRRYLNGGIQFLTLWVALIGICMLIFYFIASSRENKSFTREQTNFDKESIADWKGIQDGLRELRERFEGSKHQSMLVNKLLSTIGTFYFRGKEEAEQILSLEVDEIRQSMDSRYGMLKYFAWAVPSIGFIGTVIGIGDALGSAHNVIGQEGSFQTKGAVQVITSQLGVAFDTTLIALILSILLVFGIHTLTKREEKITENALYQIKKILFDLSPFEKENQSKRFKRLLEALNRWSSDTEVGASPFKELKAHLEQKLG